MPIGARVAGLEVEEDLSAVCEAELGECDASQLLDRSRICTVWAWADGDGGWDDILGKPAEDVWEGIFALLASIIITLMGAALLRVSKLQDKWKAKIARALEMKDSKVFFGKGKLKVWFERYAMFILPFITVLREGVEAIL